VEKQVFRLEEVAEILRLSRRHVTDLVREGSIRVVRFGRAVRVTRAELERVLGGPLVDEKAPAGAGGAR
jgi:excisionase family DNA binding protein